jgi:hypothetical protein
LCCAMWWWWFVLCHACETLTIGYGLISESLHRTCPSAAAELPIRRRRSTASRARLGLEPRTPIKGEAEPVAPPLAHPYSLPAAPPSSTDAVAALQDQARAAAVDCSSQPIPSASAAVSTPIKSSSLSSSRFAPHRNPRWPWSPVPPDSRPPASLASPAPLSKEGEGLFCRIPPIGRDNQ